jgi:hypothetical protein
MVKKRKAPKKYNEQVELAGTKEANSWCMKKLGNLTLRHCVGWLGHVLQSRDMEGVNAHASNDRLELGRNVTFTIQAP